MRDGFDWANRGNCTRRQENLRVAGCHVDRRKCRAYLRVHHEQETGGGHRCAGAGCEDRLRGAYEEGGRLGPAGRGDGGNREAHGQESGGVDYRYGSAAGAHGGTWERSVGVGGSAYGAWSRVL